MKLFFYEFQKIFFKRTLLIVLACAMVLNAALIYRNIYPGWGAKPTAVKALYSDVKAMPDSEREEYFKEKTNELDVISRIDMQKSDSNFKLNLPPKDLEKYTEIYKSGDFLKYTDTIEDERALLKDAERDYKTTAGYKDYLDDIKNKAAKMDLVSIFSKPNTYSYRNIKKTAQDFGNMHNVHPTFDISQGVNLATDFAITDIISLFLIIYICSMIVFNEKEEGQYMLSRSTYKGRRPLFLAKIAVAAVSCLIIIVLMFSVNFIIAAATFGFGDISRAIQSVAGFNGSILKVNVSQYFFIFLLTKLCAYILCAFVVVLICVKAKNIISVYLFTSILFAAEYLLYTFIPPFCAVSFFKHINLMNFIFVNPIFKEYINIDMFGFPINILPTAAVTVLVVIALMAIFSTHVFIKMEQTTTKSRWGFKGLGGKSVRLFFHESFKMLVSNKGVIIIIALVALQVYSFCSYTYRIDEDDLYYSGYMQKLAGELTPEKEDYIKSEQQKFAEADKMQNELGELYAQGKISDEQYSMSLNSVAQSLKTRKAFRRVESRYQYIKNADPAKHLVFCDDLGFNIVFDSASDIGSYKNTLLMFAALIGCAAALFSMENANGFVNLIRTYKKGRRRTFEVKTLTALGVAIPVMLVSFFGDLINVFRFYNMDYLNAPAASLPMFSYMPSNVTILGCIALFMLQRLFMAFCAAILILFVSEFTKNNIASFCVSAAVLISPVILHLLGITLLDSFTLNTFISKDLFVSANAARTVTAYAVAAILVTLAAFVTAVSFDKPIMKHKFAILKNRG